MIETQLERIATALEKIAGGAVDLGVVIEAAKDVVDVAAEPETKTETKTETKAEAKPDEVVSRDDVKIKLTKFVTDGPGKEVAKGILAKFKAGSISTLDPDNYAAFLVALDEAGVAQAAAESA